MSISADRFLAFAVHKDLFGISNLTRFDSLITDVIPKARLFLSYE